MGRGSIAKPNWAVRLGEFMRMYSLAVASAQIRHRRYLPTAHSFSSQLTYLWFDPDQIETFTQNSWLWSSSRWNLLTLDERDFLNMEYG